MNYSQRVRAYEKAGLVLGRVDTERNGGPDGTVLEQRPWPGMRVAKGDQVELVAVSR